MISYKFFNGECSIPELTAIEDLSTNRITRILTTDFPQYFAIITRIRQEVHAIGPEGGMVSSTVIPQVQAIFPEGALTKKIKVGLQVNNPTDSTDHPPPKSGRALINNHFFEKATHNRSPSRKSGFFAEFVRRTWPKLELFSFMWGRGSGDHLRYKFFSLERLSSPIVNVIKVL